MSTRIYNLGVHNYSSTLILSPSLTQALGLGLKFTPTPRNLNIQKSLKQIWTLATRRIRLLEQFKESPTTQVKFFVKHPHFQPEFMKDLLPMEDTLKLICDKIDTTMDDDTTTTIIDYSRLSRQVNYKYNLSLKQKHELCHLLQRQDILIKPADKNLGLTLLDTDWYLKEIFTKHLIEPSYEKLHPVMKENLYHRIQKLYISQVYWLFINPVWQEILWSNSGTRIYHTPTPDNGKRTFFTFGNDSMIDKNQASLLEYLLKFTIPYKSSSTTTTTTTRVATNSNTSNSGNSPTHKIPTFYLIPKVHKPVLAGRPITAAHSYFLTPLSCLFAHLLQPILSKTTTYLKDTASLIKVLWNFKNNKAEILRNLDQLTTRRSSLLSSSLSLSNRTTFSSRSTTTTTPISVPGVNTKILYLISGDVESLYPSIPINDVLKFFETVWVKDIDISQFSSGSYTHEHLVLLFQLLMENSLVQVPNCNHDWFYRQKIGVPMGTPSAPQIASLFLAELEASIKRTWSSYLCLWKRFIDDIFVIFYGTKLDLYLFIRDYNSLHSAIKINWNISTSEVAFLDLHIYLDYKNDLQWNTHQKVMNNYLYIPFKSFHPRFMKTNFIVNELKRYCRNSSLESNYLETRTSFWFRLRARGYPATLLSVLFDKVTWDTTKALRTSFQINETTDRKSVV